MLPESALSAVSSESCATVWLLVPWTQDILTAIEKWTVTLSDYHLDQWHSMHIGAQPVLKSLIKRWKEVFLNHQYDTNYGLSESTGSRCVHLGLGNIDHVGAIGVPGYRRAAKIMDESGCKVEQGAVGELCVKGLGLMECYYKDPAVTAEALQDEWLHTGDMARQDEDGFYWLMDRKKDAIITDGKNLYLVQIEDFMSGDPDIQDVAVIGLSDECLEEIAYAVVELKPGSHATEDDINKFCRFRTTGSRAGSSSRMCRAMRQARSRSRSFGTATARRDLWTTRTSLRGDRRG